MVVRARWWWSRNEGEQTKTNCDLVNGGLKLCSRLKIAFDIDTIIPDNKFYFTITLEVV